jgi:nucleotide-binding universal stress UspA family protein
MYPFRNILFPTNFSGNAHAALKYAAAFARDSNGRVFLLNVQNAAVPANLVTMPDYVFEREDDRWLLQLRDDMKTLLKDPLLKGVAVEPYILEGDASEQILRAVLDHEIDLITIVTRGRKGLSRAFGGSIAEEIIAGSSCPVLAMKPPQRDFVQHRHGQTHIRLDRVLLATNFRPSSVAATQLAAQVATHLEAELHAVYVIGDYFDQISAVFPEGGIAALKRFRSYVSEKMTQLTRKESATAHIAEGRPYEEIVKIAATLDADLIVIGAAVHTSILGGNLVLGSDTERVIRNAPCPVLCVPAAKVLTPLPSFVNQAVPQT